MNLKFYKYKYYFIFTIYFTESIYLPLRASAIHNDDLIQNISSICPALHSEDNFDTLLHKLDNLRHGSKDDKKTAYDVYDSISKNHSYLENQHVPHQNRFYRGFSKTAVRLGNDDLALTLLINFIQGGNADLTTESCYYDLLYYIAYNEHGAIAGWKKICKTEDATPSLKANAHLKLGEHFKDQKEMAISHFAEALKLSPSDQSVLHLYYKAKALIGLAQLEDSSSTKHNLFTNALEILTSIKHQKSSHNELLIHTYSGLACNPNAPYYERKENFDKALQISIEIGDYYSKAQAYIGLGNMVDNNDQGRKYYNEAIDIVGEHRSETDIYLLAQAYIGLGNIGDKQSFEDALFILKPLGKDKYPRLWAQAYIGLGQNPKATPRDRKLDLEDAIEITKKHQKYDLLAKAYISMGNGHFGSKYFKKALHYLKRVGRNEHPRLWAQAYLGLANSLDIEESEDRFSYYKMARDIAYDNDFQSLLEQAYRGLGHLHLYKKEFIKSVVFFNDACEISDNYEVIEKKLSSKFYPIIKQLLSLGFEYRIKQKLDSPGELKRQSQELFAKDFSRLNRADCEIVNNLALEGFKTLKSCEQEAIRVFFPNLKKLTDSYTRNKRKQYFDDSSDTIDSPKSSDTIDSPKKRRKINS